MGLAVSAKQVIIAQHRKHERDVGSTAVQIALLTEHIRQLTEHLKVFQKDIHSRHGLTNMVSRRRRLLKYLKHSGGDAYHQLIQQLGLRETV